MNFDVKTEKLSEEQYVISLAGEVDLYTAPEFKQQLLEVIDQGGRDVVVDLSDTTFIDSTTLGVLVGGVKRLRTNEGQLSLVCSDRNIAKIFEITGLDRVFTIHERVTRPWPRWARGRPRSLTRVLPPPARSCLRCSPRVAAARSGSRRPARGTPEAARSCSSRSAAAATRSRTRARRARSGRTSTTRSCSRALTGSAQATIQSVVRGQIEYPVEEPSTGAPGMPGPDTLLPECDEGSENEPQGCVADQNQAAEDIAAYVASVAGLQTAAPPPAAGADTGGSTPKVGAGGGPDGEAVFASAGCGGCHVLEAAGSSGNVGPSLDEAKPSKELVIERVTNGKGAMPSFADSQTPDEIAAVADYVVASTGG